MEPINHPLNGGFVDEFTVTVIGGASRATVQTTSHHLRWFEVGRLETHITHCGVVQAQPDFPFWVIDCVGIEVVRQQ